MSIAAAGVFWFLVSSYLLVGLVFGIAFVNLGAQKIDPAAKNMSLPARLMILPGVATLWPLMLVKWITQSRPPVF